MDEALPPGSAIDPRVPEASTRYVAESIRVSPFAYPMPVEVRDSALSLGNANNQNPFNLSGDSILTSDVYGSELEPSKTSDTPRE